MTVILLKTHIENTTQKAKQTIHIVKALTTTHWGKSKETLNITYKTKIRPILEYASTIWSPIISNTKMNKLQTIQNSALRTITGCTLDRMYTHHQHTQTKILPIDTHMELHGSQLRQQAQDPEHTLHRLTTQESPARLKKQTIFHNNNYTNDIDTPPDTLYANNSSQQNTELNTTRNKQHRTSTPTLHKKTSGTTPHKQSTNPTHMPTQNHSINSPNTELSPMPLTPT